MGTIEREEFWRAEVRTLNDPPEECKLIAHNTGDGWALAVENLRGDVVCYLAWPKSWPETVSREQLRGYGFEIV